MAAKFIGAKIVPLSLKLALEFREMSVVKGERKLKGSRSKEWILRISEEKFDIAEWAFCVYNGKRYRINGNHTSNIFSCCFQAHTKEGLDTKSSDFLKTYIFTKGGKWNGNSAKQLPYIAESGIMIDLREYSAETEEELIELFNERYDSRIAARSVQDQLGVEASRYNELNEIGRFKISKALSGIVRYARAHPTHFGFTDAKELDPEGGQFTLLRNQKIRECVRWIVENVGYAYWYEASAGAQLFTEIWLLYGKDNGSALIEKIEEEVENEGTYAFKWENEVNKKKQRKAVEAVLKQGRVMVEKIAEQLGFQKSEVEEDLEVV